MIDKREDPKIETHLHAQANSIIDTKAILSGVGCLFQPFAQELQDIYMQKKTEF